MYGLVGIRFDDIHENYFDKDTNVRLFVNVLTQRNWIESVMGIQARTFVSIRLIYKVGKFVKVEI